jgi:F0F1-type ATP synthase assembly protein I
LPGETLELAVSREQGKAEEHLEPEPEGEAYRVQLTSGVAVGVLVGLFVGVPVGAMVGVPVAVTVAVFVGVSVGA